MDRLSMDCPDLVAMHPNAIEAACHLLMLNTGELYVGGTMSILEWRRMELERWRLAHGDEVG